MKSIPEEKPKSNINKENFKQALFDYFSDNYEKRVGGIINELKNEYPYDDEGLNQELSMKNFIEWLMIEKPMPDTGKTIVEEFIEKNSDIPEDIKNCMAGMKNIVRGKFKVLSYSNGVVKLEKNDTKKEYNVRLYNTTNSSTLKNGSEIIGRIHEFDEYYRFAGIFVTKMLKPDFLFPDPHDLLEWFEENQIKKIQNNILSNNMSITAMLRNYHSTWIDAICGLHHLNSRKKDEKINMISHKLNTDLVNIVESLSQDSKEILKNVLNKEGIIKYSELREYEDYIGYFWAKNEVPEYPIGALVRRGLLFIGKIPFSNGRMYKVALV